MLYAISVLVLFILMLLINALIIRGINLITTGRTEIRPDGNEVDFGKIGYPIRKYFEAHTIEKVYYKDEQLKILLSTLKQKIPHIVDYRDSFCLGIYVTKEQLNNFISNKAVFGMNINGLLFDYEDEGEIIQIYFYKEYLKYKYPLWVRMMIYDCPPCMSSIYGSLFYWVFTLFIFKFNFSIELVCVWLFYWLSLAYVNALIEKK